MGSRANLKIAYVKDTQKIYYYDPKKNTTTFVGKVKDAVVALHCQAKSLRKVDLDANNNAGAEVGMEENKNDLER